MEPSTPKPVIYRSETRRRIAQTNLKRCPLCNALNAQANGDCFVCGWHGEFDHDPFRIEESLIRLIYQCPDMQVESAPEPTPIERPKLIERLRNRLAGRRLDFRA